MRPPARRSVNPLLPSISRPCARRSPRLPASPSSSAIVAPTLGAGEEDTSTARCVNQRRSITQNYIRKTKLAEEQWAAWAHEINEGRRQSFVSKLQDRGLLETVVGGDIKQLDKLVTNVRAGFYAGFDATAPSLHVGHLVPIMILGWAYIHGMKAYYLLGGTTCRFGDPSGRTEGREELNSAVRKANIAHLHMQLKKIGLSTEKMGAKFGYEWEWSWRRALINNNTWWNKDPLQDVLHIMGRHAKVGDMLSRDFAKSRLESGKGLSLAEFCYPLMQAWDYWVLFQKGIQIQVGGSDQEGNIHFGVQMIKDILKNDPKNELAPKKNEDPHLKLPLGVTTPLITTSAGEKLGKSDGNAVWLDGDMTSPFDFYQYFMRLPDADMERYLKLFTFMPLSEIREVMDAHNSNPSDRIAQHKLAQNVVELIHGPNVAKDMERQHRLIFAPNTAVPVAEPEAAAANEKQQTGFMNPVADGHAPQTNLFNNLRPHVTLPRSLVVDQFFHKVLYSAGMVSSKQEGFRVIVNRGAHVGCRADARASMSDALSYTPIKTWSAGVTKDFIIDNSLMILKIGKWKVKIVKIVDDDEFERMGLTAPGWKEAEDGAEQKKDADLIASKQKLWGHRVKPPAISRPPGWSERPAAIRTYSRSEDGTLELRDEGNRPQQRKARNAEQPEGEERQ